MDYYLIAELGGKKMIFGLGNTKEMAVVSGRWNACEYGATKLRVLPKFKLPKNVKWFDEK